MNPVSATLGYRSYAKVNLTLDVLGKRPDGYHDIESVMQTISLHDVVTVIRLRRTGEPGIRVTCDMPGIPTDERNLAHKAARMCFEDLGAMPGVDIHIEKRIPPEAGLGGGSSNGAATISALSRLFGGGSRFQVPGARLADGETLDPKPETLNSAAAVGSDVPFFLVGGTALVRGRGEEVEALPDIPTQWLVIVKPPFGISTPWAYGRLDEIRAAGETREPGRASARMVECIQSGDWQHPADLLSNDLETPAIERHPEIGELKEELLHLGASGSLMCGSGSAVFGIFPSEDAARKACEALAGGELRTFVCRTVGRGEIG